MNPLDYSGALFRDPVCGRCDDSRRVAPPPGQLGDDGKPLRSVPCPVCGTKEQRRDVFMRAAKMPELTLLDLTDEELEIVKGWKAAGHHPLDCLRWIEGRRYDSAMDEAFRAVADAKLAEWREARNGLGERPEGSAVKSLGADKTATVAPPASSIPPIEVGLPEASSAYTLEDSLASLPASVAVPALLPHSLPPPPDSSIPPSLAPDEESGPW